MTAKLPKISFTSRAYRLFKDALGSHEHDLTAISLRRAVVLLSIPMMLELVLESVFAVVNIFYLNRLSVHAVSVVGLTEAVITLVYSVGVGLGAAATAYVARRTGEKNPQGASVSAAQVILVSFVMSVVLAVPGYLFAADILHLMGAEPEAIRIGETYTRIMFAGNLSIILLFVINGAFRGAGNASIAMKSLWPDLSVIRGLISVAYPATLQFLIASASWIVIAALVAQYGSAASGGYQTTVRLFLFFILPAWGMSNAAATLVGQNLGAKLPDRAEESVWVSLKYNLIFMAAVTALLVIFPEKLLSVFIPPGETAR
ncbi:hypothetical protein CHS0354_001944 [Potamilus streckersoni]|uniref:MATE family efflux transporter n=1 Tax=Potamilus streckersoni TaxID=2493646 RepID=A0AAE0T5E0_9BIVA|nr:hypothetical protein CHS0354_001944 [Potamilus streckersoni]